MPLSTLPSLAHAMHEGPILTNDFEALIASEGPRGESCFEDWVLQFRTYGVRSFLTLPLVFAGQVGGWQWRGAGHTHATRYFDRFCSFRPCFLYPPCVPPLTQDLGALIFMSPKAGAIHGQMQLLIQELGVQVAHSLYLWSCQDKMEAGGEGRVTEQAIGE